VHLQLFPVNLGQNIGGARRIVVHCFSCALEIFLLTYLLTYVHPVHPLATPMRLPNKAEYWKTARKKRKPERPKTGEIQIP